MNETTPTQAAQTREQLLKEIEMKMRVQPEDVELYRFNDHFEIETTDGNHYDCYGIKQVLTRCPKAWLFSKFTDEFYTDVENLTDESLALLSDSIEPPRTIMVTFQCRADSDPNSVNMLDFPFHEKVVLHDFTEDDLFEYLHAKFPTFDWQPDDEDQYVFYPDPDDKSHYFLGSCYRPDTTNEGSSFANSHYPVCD